MTTARKLTMRSNPRIPYEMASDRYYIAPPQGRPLIVHVVVNVEVWPFDQPMPRKVFPAPHGQEQTPDVPNFSWAEYGMRCGMPRLLDAMAERALPASAFLNSSVIEVYPSCAVAMREAEWEFVGHGVVQKAITSEPDERAVIRQSLDEIEAFTGARPRGWLGPGLRQSHATPENLRREGVEYCFDWVIDDLPCWMTTQEGPLLALPYAIQLNDSVVYAIETQASSEYWRRFESALALLEREIKRQPRVMTLALHPHLIGTPDRFGYFEKVLDTLLARDDVVFMTGAGIADWYKAAVPYAASA